VKAPWTRHAAPLVLALLIAAAYGGSLRNEYVFDDLMFIRDDPRVRSLAEAPRLFVEPLWGYADKEGRVHLHQYYRPLQTFPLAIFYALTGEEAWLAHLYSLTLHWLNCVLAFAILRRITGAAGAALAAVALFAVHPGYSEAVLWVSDYAGLGADLCILSIFLLHLSGHGGRWYGWLLTAALTLLGLWHKESGILAPVLVGAYELLRWSTERRQIVSGDRFSATTSEAVPQTDESCSPSPVLWERGAGGEGNCRDELDSFATNPAVQATSESDNPSLSPPVSRLRSVATLVFRYSAFVPPVLLYQYLRLKALGGMLPGFDAVPLTPYELALNAVGLIPDFVRTFFWPFELNMYRDFDAIHGIANLRFAVGAFVLLCGAVAFFASLRRRPAVAFGLFWAAATAAPHLLVRWPQLNVFAERYVYIPAIGLFLAAAGVARWTTWTGWTRWTRGVSLIGYGGLLVVFVVRVILRVPDWHDDLVMYGKAVRQSPRASLARNNLAVKLLELKRYDEGIALLEELKVLDPNWRNVNKNLGLLYLGKGDDAKAAECFEAAERADPFDRTVTLNLGYVYDKMGQRERAVAKYFELVNAEPRNTHGWYNLALIATEAGQFENAGAAVKRILQVDPADRPALLLGKRLKQIERPSLDADDAVTLRRCETARRAADEKRYAEATYTLQMAAWLDESSPLPHQYLANVAFLQGHLRRAVEHQRAALARDPDNALYRRNLESLEAALAARAD